MNRHKAAVDEMNRVYVCVSERRTGEETFEKKCNGKKTEVNKSLLGVGKCKQVSLGK